MITQQTAAYLIKKVEAVKKSLNDTAKDPTESHIKDLLKNGKNRGDEKECDVLGSDEAVVHAFRRRSADLCVRAYEQRILNRRSWNSLLIQLHKLSRAHSQSILVENFYSALQHDTTIPASAKPVLEDLFRLFALFTMDAESREFYSSGSVSNEQLDALPDVIQELMGRVRVHAVKLVDSWMVPDYLLDSALGRYDGKVSLCPSSFLLGRDWRRFC